VSDLATDYLGLALHGPVVASAGPLTGRLDTLRRLEDAGAAAVVLPSLFEEEIVGEAFALDALHRQGADVFAEAQSYLPELPDTEAGPDHHLRLVAEAKASLAIPVIASLNGTTTGGWLEYAGLLAEAGADALELNVYLVAADLSDTAASVESNIVDLVHAVATAVDIPVAVKLSPYFTSFTNLADRLEGAGAMGLVLFNRFYQPDIDLDALDVAPTLELSTPADLRLPLRWTGILRGRIGCSLALSGGVHGPLDVVKAVIAGADVAMSTSALLRHGPEHLRTLLAGLDRWLDEHEYDSVGELRGAMSQHRVADPDAYERANYVRVLRWATTRYR